MTQNLSSKIKQKTKNLKAKTQFLNLDLVLYDNFTLLYL